MIDISSGGKSETFPLILIHYNRRSRRAVSRKCLVFEPFSPCCPCSPFLGNKYVQILIFDKPSDNS